MQTSNDSEPNDSRRYPSRPYVGVGAVIWRGENVLLIKRGHPPRKGQWSLPGGAQNLGETIIDAVEREVREETSLAIEVIDIIAVVDSIDRDANGKVRYHYTLVDVSCEWRAGEAEAQDDAVDLAWVSPDDLHRYDLWSETNRIIRLAAASRCIRE